MTQARELALNSEDCGLPVSEQNKVVPCAGELLANRSPLDLLAPNWFAIYTTPRHEKRVVQHLGIREIEYYLPLYHPQHRWSDGSLVTLDLPLFPGYVFVHIDRSLRVRVLEIPGVLTFVGGTGGKPAPLPEVEIEALRSGLALRRAEPHPLLTVGQRARIRSGALTGMEGVVLRQKNSLRVVLTVELIMQSVAVEVDISELEVVDPRDSGPPKGCVLSGVGVTQGASGRHRRFV
ncbi:MAG: UpxY family transcription antiterminator [Terracidiphilus sp.]